jgi:zeaxanthin epoxidase
MPYTGVIDRPDLQEIYLENLPKGIIKNGDGVASYERNKNGHGVKVHLDSGKVVEGDVLIGADVICSAVRATMRDEPIRGDESGVSYSGYTVFAGELAYDSFDNGLVGYKVYIGPGQYFVITDIGNKCYQWYAFLARPPGSAKTEEMPEGKSLYLQNIFAGWSEDIHHILKATQENEIDQRDLYDRPPSVRKPWTEGSVALLGDAGKYALVTLLSIFSINFLLNQVCYSFRFATSTVHAMMPNLGQGGCQAIEDAFVISQELGQCKNRKELESAMKRYRGRRLVRSAAVQGLSRFASDIIIRGFDTPAKITNKDGSIKFENFNYAGIVTSILRPILPIFFSIQFAYLYDGWKNDNKIDANSAAGLAFFGGLILLLAAGSVGEVGLVLAPIIEGLFGTEGIIYSASEGIMGSDFFSSISGMF